jgi:hypothetical protein
LTEAAASVSLLRLEHLVDEAPSADLVRLGEISDGLTSAAHPGRQGLDSLAAVLDQRSPGIPVSTTSLEAKMLSLLERAGLRSSSGQMEFPAGCGTAGSETYGATQIEIA